VGLDHITDYLVTQDDWQLCVGKFPIDDMEIGPADPTGMNPQQNLARPRLRN
jgi:hypothetical protein